MAKFCSSRLVLVAGCVLALIAGTVISAQRSSSSMASAATAFVNGLSSEQRRKALFTFNSGERVHWHFIPSEMFPRNGLLMKDMSDNQRKLAHSLIKSALSQRGYMTAATIMDLESTLGDLELRDREAVLSVESIVVDPLKYYASIFATSSMTDTWCRRLDG